MGNEAPKMEAQPGGDVTRVLDRAQKGDVQAAAELLPLVYNELRKLAAAKMARDRPDQTLQPTALVHEAWLHLGGDKQPAWQNRAHFFGAAAEAMRRILVDRARRKQALVLASSNLAAPLNTWSNLGPATETPPGSGQFTDHQATNYPQRFYRVSSP